MDVGKKRSGFEEVEHTGDRALHVWAADWNEFLKRAAEGLYKILGLDLAPGLLQTRELTLEAVDAEGLLVAFLNELLFLAEDEGLAFDVVEVEASQTCLRAIMEGAKIVGWRQEVKAVTYSNLEIMRNEMGFYEATVVFDV